MRKDVLAVEVEIKSEHSLAKSILLTDKKRDDALCKACQWTTRVERRFPPVPHIMTQMAEMTVEMPQAMTQEMA